MNEDKDIRSDSTTVPPGVDDAVGVSDAKWFIAIINNHSEKSIAEKLSKLGVENYLPTRKEIHLWRNGKKAKVEKIMSPSKIFIRCSEHQRRELVNLPYIFRFMINMSGTKTQNGTRPLAIVPNHEIQQLKFMLGVPDVDVRFSESFVKGEKVKVLRGPLRGLVGEILQDAESGTNRLHINIDFLGSASVMIESRDVQPIK